uniref:Uncharacterized protein n=1 Tax=Knipowitschia caucasica TaxID=637954 RepID=A0AAV2L0X0_KNICA
MPFLRGARPSQAGQASGRHTGHPAHVITLIEGAALPAGPPHPRSARHSSGRGSSPGSCALCNPVFLFAGAALTSASAAACRNGVFHDGAASSTYLFLFHGRGSVRGFFGGHI